MKAESALGASLDVLDQTATDDRHYSSNKSLARLGNVSI
jgi:hypothetical protein